MRPNNAALLRDRCLAIGRLIFVGIAISVPGQVSAQSSSSSAQTVPQNLAIPIAPVTTFDTAQDSSDGSSRRNDALHTALLNKIDAIWNHGDLRDLEFIEKTFDVKFSAPAPQGVKTKDQDGTCYQRTANTKDSTFVISYAVPTTSSQLMTPGLEYTLYIDVQHNYKPLVENFKKWATPEQKNGHTLTLSSGVNESGWTPKIIINQYVGGPPKNYKPVFQMGLDDISAFTSQPVVPVSPK